MSILSIANFHFNIDLQNSYIEEYNEQYTKWDIFIRTEEGIFNHEYQCTPNIRGKEIRADVGIVSSMEGQKLIIIQKDFFSLYLQKHCTTYNHVIEFGKIISDTIEITWNGVIEDLCWNSELDKDVPFKISCQLPIKYRISTEDYFSPQEEAIELLNQVAHHKDEDAFTDLSDLLHEVSLNQESYQKIIQRMTEDDFLEACEDFLGKLVYFIDEFLYNEIIPQTIKKEAKKIWKTVNTLNEIMEETA